ncbi:MAG: DNA polymerase [Planctomycetota bacterium]
MPSPATRPEITTLFVDMDAFFASCEQMDHPHLRGLPVAVTPTPADSGCCIATSYEARARGVRTGCRVKDARDLCPGIEVIRARPDRYIQIHHEILAAIDTAVPVGEVLSIDECACDLLSNERDEPVAVAIGHAIKDAIAERIGTITCSVGLAPNRLLAKVAAGSNKPDGLTVIRRSDLPDAITHLALTDLPGISKGIARRLRAAGITTMGQLYARTESELRAAWGSVLGAYWHMWIRGEHADGPPTRTRTCGHQHVLAPKHRGIDSARGVAERLLGKAAQRMRTMAMTAGALRLGVWALDRGPGQRSRFSDWTPAAGTDDTRALRPILFGLWDAMVAELSPERIIQVSVRLEDLRPAGCQLPLFEGERQGRALMRAIDEASRRYGVDAVFPGSMFDQRKTAPRRIPFGKPPDLAIPDFDGEHLE